MNWRELNESLADMSEKQVQKLLDEELADRRRATVITRLHQRFTILRAARERKELLKSAKSSR